MRTYFRVFFFFAVSCVSVNDARTRSEKLCTLIESGERCRAVYYKDCTANILQREYPGLYNHDNGTMAAPTLTVTTTDKSYTRGTKVKWYSEAGIIIRPNPNSSVRIQGFEVWIKSIEGTRCLVVTLSDNGTLSNTGSMASGFHFSLALRMSVNMTVWPLPKTTSSSPARSSIRAGINRAFPPENSSLWYSEIWYRKNSRDRIVEVQFQTAPESYGIQYYNIQLRKVTLMNTGGASYRTTSHSWMEFVRSPWVYVKFRNVEPGAYVVKVEPYDDLVNSKNKTCRCRMNAECHPCNSSKTPVFTIADIQPYTTDTVIKTSMTMATSNTYDLNKLVNKLTSTNRTTLIKTKHDIFSKPLSPEDMTITKSPEEIFSKPNLTGPATLTKTQHEIFNRRLSKDGATDTETLNTISSSRPHSTDGTTLIKTQHKVFTPMEIFNRPHSTNSTTLVKTKQKIFKKPRPTDGTTVIETPQDIFTQSVLSLRRSSILNPSLSDVFENNSQTGMDFQEDMDETGGSQRSGGWKIPVFSVIGITVGAVVSIFAVVRFRRRGQSSVSKSSSAKQIRTEKSLLIIHDIKHSKDAQSLMNLIIQELHIDVETVLFPSKGSLINNSEASIYVLWMNPQSFTKFECRFLKDKELPSLEQTNLQSRFVVIESNSAGCTIQPRIQYWTKFVLDTELELFIDFLRNNTTQEVQKSWITDQHISTETPEKFNVFPRQYSRMDSGIHSEYENEADFLPCEDKSHEEYASIAAVTIAEYHMGVPHGHQNKVTASYQQFSLSNSTTDENANGLGQNPDISRLNTKDRFIPPEVMSCYDVEGSLFSEDVMLLNERNLRPAEAEVDSLTLIEDHVGKHCTAMNHRSETPVCFQNMMGFINEEEEFQDDSRCVDEVEEREDNGRCVDEDTISVGGQSC